MMFNYSNTKIKKLIVHRVGNKGQDEPLELSQRVLLDFNRELRGLLVTYFLSAFKKMAFNHFYDSTDIGFNKVYMATSELFSNDANFLESSMNLAKHLYDCSEHPMIKSGEFYVAHFENCILNDEVLDVVGIFKSENKESFLTIHPEKGDFGIGYSEGIDIRKLDKGCLIFNTDQEEGYKILSLDLNSSVEAKYWKKAFLGIQPSADEYHNTENYLTLTKAFVNSEYSDEIKAEKVDQADLLNRSYDYFKEQHVFNEKDFKSKVLKSDSLIESFDEYKRNSLSDKDFQLSSEFSISSDVVKKKSRVFKSVIKLDSNFHIYVHGARDLIEKGFDDNKGKSFYKVYFDREE